LDGDFFVGHWERISQFHQSAKLGVIVDKKKLIIFIFDEGVKSGDGDIAYSNVTLVPSSLK
jgi:hypothetical protein